MRDFERWAGIISSIVTGLFALLLWLNVASMPVTIVKDNTKTTQNGGTSAQQTAYYELAEENPGFVRVA